MRKSPTPQQRAIEKKRARWRAWRNQGRPTRFDPDTYDFETVGNHFDRLSDDEWAPVWKTIQQASPNKSLDEERLRQLVNKAAFWSGWFVECGGEISFYSMHYKLFADEERRFLEKIKAFRSELEQFLGEPSAGGSDPWDPWAEHRDLLPALDQLAAQVHHNMADNEHQASITKNPPNAAHPKLDAWRARLVLLWRDEFGLAIKNTKLLRTFLINALDPYMPGAATDRTTKEFIKKWLDGKVPEPSVLP